MSAPREMPTSGASMQEFEPQRVDYVAPEGSGRLGAVQAGFPLWLARWTIGRLGETRSDSWRAFDIGQRGATRSFLARDLRRPYPKAHIDGFAGMVRAGTATAFDGSATSWSEAINTDNDSLLTLNGLPAGLVLSIGDYVGFKWDAAGAPASSHWRRAMSRVTVAGTASGTGTATITVEPPLPTVVPAAAIAHLDRPACVMRKLTEESRLEPIDRGGGIRGGLLVGLQDLRA